MQAAEARFQGARAQLNERQLAVERRLAEAEQAGAKAIDARNLDLNLAIAEGSRATQQVSPAARV